MVLISSDETREIPKNRYSYLNNVKIWIKMPPLSEGRGGEQKNISLYYKQKHNHLLDMCIYNEALHCSVRS